MNVPKDGKETKVVDFSDLKNRKKLEAEFTDLKQEKMYEALRVQLKELGVDSDTLQYDDEKRIGWQFAYNEEMAVTLGIEIDPHGDLVNFIDIVVVKIPNPETLPMLKDRVNFLNQTHTVPLTTVVEDDAMVVRVIHRAENDCTNPEIFFKVFEVAINHSIQLLKTLTKEFNLPAFFAK